MTVDSGSLPVLEALGALPAAGTALERVQRFCDGLLIAGAGSAAAAIITGSREIRRGVAGRDPLPPIEAVTVEELEALADALAVTSDERFLTLRQDDRLVGIVTVHGGDREQPLFSGYLRTATAYLDRELRLARTASIQRHDLRGPITVILGWCELLTESVDEASKPTAETIARQALKMNDLLDQHAAALGGTAASAERL